MNKSEIAEKAARRAHREIMKFALQLGCNLADSDWKQFDALVEAAVERAIAESQVDDLGKRAMKVLHDLTPGGSEFYNEPKRCAEYIQEKLDNQAEITKRAIIRAKKAELGDGEPSPPPATYKILAEIESIAQRTTPPYAASALVKILELATDALKGRCGAAQEVSPVGSVQTITGPERPRCPRCGAETTCLSCGQEVSPGPIPGIRSLTPEESKDLANYYKKIYSKVDTRELKAALRKALLIHWLSQIECNHEEKNDSAICACGWKSERGFNVGKAVELWIDHVFSELG